MTILHLARSFGGKRIGGAERNIYNLVHLISLNSEEINLILSDNGIWEYHSKSKTFKRIETDKINIFLLLVKKHNIQNISNIHLHSNGYYIFLGYIISLLIRSRLIIKLTRIGDGSLLNRNKKEKISFRLLLKRKLFKYLCKANNVHIHILTTSCLDLLDNSTTKIVVFPNLIKKGEFNPDIKKKDTFVISSRLIRRKNIDLALDNLLNLKNKNLHIFIIGTGPELKRLRNKYKINKSKVTFLGYLKNNEIYNYYAKAEYFINLSDSEGMSNSLIEAMSFGCKCLVSNILENFHTARNHAIYYEKGEDFSLKIKESLKLNPREISHYANSRFSIDSFESNQLRELYKIDNNNISCWERK